MKNYLYAFLCITICSHASAIAFLDFFDVYSKRNIKIDNVFVHSLNTKEKKWIQRGRAYPEDTIITFDFIPEGEDPKKPAELLSYSEINVKKRPDLTDVNSLYNLISRKKKMPPEWQEHILVKSTKELIFEAYLPEKKLLCDPMHIITKILQTGDKTFRTYEYRIEGRTLSQEEKSYWLQMFDYLKIDF